MSPTRTAPLLMLLLGSTFACSRPAADPRPAATTVVNDSATFVDRVWRVEQSTGASPGELVVFLSTGTLVFASPNGTPAFGTWTYADGTLTMVEEGISYKTEILGLSQSEFRIRSLNPGGAVETRFVPANGSAPSTP